MHFHFAQGPVNSVAILSTLQPGGWRMKPPLPRAGGPFHLRTEACVCRERVGPGATGALVWLLS